MEAPQLKALATFGIVQNLGADFGFAIFVQDDDRTPLRAAFEIPDEGQFLVDWEATLPYSERDLADLIEDRTAGPATVRVELRRSDYYNFAFADKGLFACFAITQPGSHTPAYAYFHRDHPDYPAFAKFLLDSGDTPERAAKVFPTIRLGRPDAAHADNQFEIAEALSHYWLVP